MDMSLGLRVCWEGRVTKVRVIHGLQYMCIMYEQKQDRNYWRGVDISRTKKKKVEETNLMLTT